MIICIVFVAMHIYTIGSFKGAISILADIDISNQILDILVVHRSKSESRKLDTSGIKVSWLHLYLPELTLPKNFINIYMYTYVCLEPLILVYE